MVVQESGVFLLDRDAEVLELDQLWARSEVDQLWIVVREGESMIPRVLKRVVADKVVHDVVPLNADRFLDETSFLEWVRIDKRTQKCSLPLVV